ncbi:Rrf2 family transcriptional regulator [Leptospirillum ferrooxidans]|uniref:Putative transcriptional regulator, BadM/Rrf2 family n=1 Tax=Leptospirillum ferrooxidans (strain C2-3) TaxID=1162668 RepID=I0IN29_LEPFC|nr:Rrf2 family transcriptional regulator [Leptospirillum ferrooxidans]BAM06678.1 putative transcriptional regulator, BadM/Rrf2 family [Leptospirillum ferrooxidans C2-3]
MIQSSRFAVATHIMVGLGYIPKQPPRADLLEGQWISSELLASSVKTNPVVVRRLLVDLKKAGLVISRQGRAGGVSLSRAPESITLLDILEAVDQGEVFAFNPNPPNTDCPVSINMHRLIAPVFQSVTNSLKKTLEQIPLSALIEGIP